MAKRKAMNMMYLQMEKNRCEILSHLYMRTVTMKFEKSFDYFSLHMHISDVYLNEADQKDQDDNLVVHTISYFRHANEPIKDIGCQYH